MKARGAFIVLEGLDGAGTTTQLRRLALALRREGHRVHTTQEPSRGPLGRLVRRALRGRFLGPDEAPAAHDVLALLFAADRLDHLQREILPALEAGQVVLCDRYVLSSLAYQGSRVPMRWVSELNARAPSPDLTLLVAVTPGTAARRRAARGSAQELYEDAAHQREIWRSYQRARSLRGRSERVVLIDGEPSPARVAQAALAAIRPLLRKRRVR
jgi:dTMP kinase